MKSTVESEGFMEKCPDDQWNFHMEKGSRERSEHAGYGVEEKKKRKVKKTSRETWWVN